MVIHTRHISIQTDTGDSVLWPETIKTTVLHGNPTPPVESILGNYAQAGIWQVRLVTSVRLLQVLEGLSSTNLTPGSVSRLTTNWHIFLRTCPNASTKFVLWIVMGHSGWRIQFQFMSTQISDMLAVPVYTGHSSPCGWIRGTLIGIPCIHTDQWFKEMLKG